MEKFLYGYERVFASGTSLRFDAINDADGKVFDTLKLTKPSGWGAAFHAKYGGPHKLVRTPSGNCLLPHVNAVSSCTVACPVGIGLVAGVESTASNMSAHSCLCSGPSMSYDRSHCNGCQVAYRVIHASMTCLLAENTEDMVGMRPPTSVGSCQDWCMAAGLQMMICAACMFQAHAIMMLLFEATRCSALQIACAGVAIVTHVCRVLSLKYLPNRNSRAVTSRLSYTQAAVAAAARTACHRLLVWLLVVYTRPVAAYPLAAACA